MIILKIMILLVMLTMLVLVALVGHGSNAPKLGYTKHIGFWKKLSFLFGNHS